MTNRSRIQNTFIGLMALATLSQAGAIKPFEDTYSLKPTLKAGDVQKSKASGDFDVNGQAIQYKAVMTAKVKDADDKGYTIEQTQSDISISVGGQDMGNGGMEPPTVTMSFDSRGVIKEIKASDEKFNGPEAYRSAALETLYVPDNPVKLGDTWTFKLDAADKKWNATTFDYKLVAAEKVGDVDTLKIEFKAKETGADGAGQEGTIWLNAKDFSLAKREAKYIKVPIPGAPVAIDGKMTINRLP